MKKRLFLALTLLATMACQQAMAQASTVGKDFWVSSTIVCSPGGAGNKATPYIAISAEKACTITIQGGLNNAINITQQVAAGSWSQFGDASAIGIPNNNPQTGRPVNVVMNTADWYPVAASDASNVRSLAGQTNHYGLHITATEDISVYVILSSENSMDASNILPLTAIQSEYYTQDYSPIVKSDFNNTISMVTILATEDNTTVEITPRGGTYDGHASGVPYTVTLQQGQTYYMMSEANQQIGGSHIKARNGRKIAVFCGIPLTNIPTNIAARDCCFEQSMPIDYWGNQFVVTRSLWKNGNLIGITATEDGTEVRINGYVVTYLNSGETYYVMLQSAVNLPHAKNPGTGPVDYVTAGDALYIETSCPCAVYSYDTGNSYKGSDSGTSEIQNSKGDPSSVWVSPLQQKINTITFGTCYTNKTQDHFLNVIAETATCQQTTLTAINGTNQIDISNTLSWTPVPGNTNYSYARTQLLTYTVFKLHNPRGFIAHIYGNGDDESYAYSCGSAAVKRGINLEGITFTDGLRGENRFCINTPLLFDAQVGTDIIDKVDWDFGDGITEYNSTPQATHEYETKGWYDVIANVYAHKDCPETVYPAEAVRFSFYVDKAEIIKHETSKCIPWDDPLATDTITDTLRYDCDSIVITSTFVRRMSKPTDIEITAKDSFLLNGEWLYESCQRSHTFMNKQECDSVVNYDVTIVHCLDIELPQDVNPECDETGVQIPFTYHKGIIDRASFVTTMNGQPRSFPLTVSADNAHLLLDISEFTPGTVEGRIETYDAICDQTLTFPITIFVRLPSNIMHQKYDNIVGITLEAINRYQLQGYQWVIDGVLQDGKNESIYYQDNGFVAGQSMEVMVLLPNGKWIQSCKLNLTGESQIDNPFRSDEATTPMRKLIHNGHIYIQIGEQTYNPLGEKVE